MAAFSPILFDLDGTIVDSAPGITASLAWTFAELGRPVPSPAELLDYVGPPLLDSFRDRGGMTSAEAQEALSLYRGRYLATGVFDATVYPGVRDTLARIHDAGIPLSLATSKPETPAKMVLDHFELSAYFTVIAGASDDEVRSAKAEVVEEALGRLLALEIDIAKPVLVGDRSHDVHGAAAHDVPTIFVRWGYGDVAEEHGAVAVVSTARELQASLGLVT